MQLVIPARNEAARLPRTLEALRAHVLLRRGSRPARSRSSWSTTRSTDDTARLAAAAHTAAMPVRVVRCDRPGKGAAVRAGIAPHAPPTRRLHGRRRRHPPGRAGRGAVRLLDAGRRRRDRLPGGARVGDHRAAQPRSGRSGASALPALHPADRPRHRRHPVRVQGVPRRPRPRGLRRTCGPTGFSFDVEVLAPGPASRRPRSWSSR